MKMRKPKYLSVPVPCSEDWNKMDATEQGAFCTKCTKEVVDLTRIRTSEIPALMATKSDPCIRVLGHQLDEMNWMEWLNSLSLRKQINHLFLLTFVFVFQFNGTAQESDTTKFPQHIEPLAIDSSKIDSSYCAPTVIINSEVPILMQVYDVKFVGIPRREIETNPISIGGAILTDHGSQSLSYISLNHNFYHFRIEEEELIVSIQGKITEKVELRIYNEQHELVYADFIRVQKGANELRQALFNLETGTYTIQLTNYDKSLHTFLTH